MSSLTLNYPITDQHLQGVAELAPADIPAEETTQDLQRIRSYLTLPVLAIQSPPASEKHKL